MTTKVVKTGLYMPNYGIFGDIHTLIQLAQLAENHGWDGFFLWDHIAYKNDQGHTVNVADPWVALTAITLQTQSIRIGTTVTSLPRRRPWKLARETAEARVAVLERTLAQRSAASAAAAEEVESQVRAQRKATRVRNR